MIKSNLLKPTVSPLSTPGSTIYCQKLGCRRVSRVIVRVGIGVGDRIRVRFSFSGANL